MHLADYILEPISHFVHLAPRLRAGASKTIPARRGLTGMALYLRRATRKLTTTIASS